MGKSMASQQDSFLVARFSISHIYLSYQQFFPLSEFSVLDPRELPSLWRFNNWPVWPQQAKRETTCEGTELHFDTKKHFGFYGQMEPGTLTSGGYLKSTI